MSEPRRATPCHSWGAWTFAARQPGLHHRRAQPSPFRPNRYSFCFQQHQYSAVNLGAAVEPVGNRAWRGAHHRPPCLPYLPSPQVSCTSHPAVLLTTASSPTQVQRNPEILRHRRDIPRKNTGPSPIALRLSSAFLPQPRPEHAVVGQLSLARLKILSANESKCLRDLHG